MVGGGVEGEPFNRIKVVYKHVTATIGNTHTNSTAIEC